MNTKFFLLIMVVSLFAASAYVAYIIKASVHYVMPVGYNATSGQAKKPSADLNILLIHTAHGFGGGEVHKIALYKLLLEHGYAARILVAQNSIMQQELQKLHLPYYTTKAGMFLPVSFLFRWALYNNIYDLCTNKPDTIVQCYTEKEVGALQRVAQFLPIKTVFERHVPTPIRHPETTLLCDAIIGVSKPIVTMLQEKAHEHASNVIIELIGPFFDEDKFLQYKPTETREQFFKQNFNLTLKDLPVITMIAQMNKDLAHKNHALLLNAVHKLVYEKNKPVEVLLVGSGPSMGTIKKIIGELKLDDYVHVLGFTNRTPDILFYSDMHVLSSSNEAFGLVHLEASLMKKPIIAATQTGAVDLIEHGYNGLLFENNNLDSLVTQIEILLDNQKLRHEMGLHAFAHATKNFSNQVKLKLLESLYQKILSK